MIRWCSYCQAFLGEVPPFHSMALTHGACATCSRRIGEGGDHDLFVDETEGIRQLMNAIFDSAARGDEARIPALMKEAAALGLRSESVLVGLLQPALYRAGEEWSNGCMSVTAEHRLTQWCERFLAQMPPHSAAADGSPLDLLIFVLPGNTHTVGPRFAGHILSSRGVRTEVVSPAVPLEEMVQGIENRRPRMVGLSCALEASLPAAEALLRELDRCIEPRWPRHFLVGGYAARNQPRTSTIGNGAQLVATVQEVEALLGLADGHSPEGTGTKGLGAP